MICLPTPLHIRPTSPFKLPLLCRHNSAGVNAGVTTGVAMPPCHLTVLSPRVCLRGPWTRSATSPSRVGMKGAIS